MTTILNKERILEQARTYIEEGKYDKAIVEYEKILVADPSDLRVKLRIAELYTKRKEINEAIRIYREVANSYAAAEFYLKAVTVLKNILRLNPTLVDVNMMLAELYEKMGLIHDSVRQYDILATTLDQKGDFSKTIDIYKKIVELTPNLASARVKLAEVLQREGKTEEAVNQYEEIAKIYEMKKMGDLKLAEVYEKILAHKKNAEMLRVLFKIYSRLGDNKKILRLAEGAKDIVSTDPELLRAQAKVYISLNQIETARNKYLAAADLEIANGNANGALGDFADILLLIPQEEERIFKKVKDMKAEERFAKIFSTRKEEKAKKEVEEQKTKDEKLKKEKEKEKVTYTQPKQQKWEPAEKVGAGKIFDEAEVIYNLGSAYLKMGLSNEAKRELDKAEKLFKEILNSGGEYKENSQKRLDAIAKLLSGETVEGKEETIALKREDVAKVNEKSIKKVANKKKKISFV